jgi:hypothetical protein
VPAPNNPAGRLCEFVSRARKTSQPHGAAAGWAQVFGLQSDDLAGVLRHGSRLIAMAKDTRRQITTLNETAAPVYLKHFGEVDQMLDNFRQLTLAMEQFLQPLNPQSGGYCLEVCSELLEGGARENILADDQVDALRSQLLDLVQAVKDADDLTDDFRKWLLDRLADISDRLNADLLYSLVEVEETTSNLLGGMLHKAGPHGPSEAK